MSVSTRHYLWFGNLILLGLIIWSAVSIGMSVVGRRLEKYVAVQRPAASGPAETPRLNTLNHYEAIVKSNPFGANQEVEAPQGKTVKPAQGAPAPKNLDLKLKGLAIDETTGFRAAILEEVKTQEQGIYRPGDTIGSYEVAAIETGRVTLRQAGKEIVLELGDETPSEASRPALPGKEIRSGVESKGDVGPIAKSVGPNSFLVSREALGQHMGDLSKFLSQIRIQPNFQDGQARGFKVMAIQPNTPVAELGLKPNDIILKINEITVNKPEDLVNLYRQVQQLETVNVHVDRQGKTETLTYSLR